MPRNIFIDTPTLTSLLFAQKKSADEVLAWDTEWKAAYADSEARIKAAAQALRKANVKAKNASVIASEFLAALAPLADARDWVLKSGKSPTVLRLGKGWGGEPGDEAAEHFKAILRSSGFEALRERYVFSKVATKLDYGFAGFEVADVGYKLSKRKERAKPNQLMALTGVSGKSHLNLHLANEACTATVDEQNPTTVLDHVATTVSWN